MTPTGSGATRAVLVSALFASALALAQCGSSNNGAGNGASDGGACASGDPSCAPDASKSDANDGGADAEAINPNGPFCVSYMIMEEFYAALTPQCSCQDAWKKIDDAEDYVALLDYYPGIYAGAHVVGACPNLMCCVRATSDDGGLVPEGCLCSGASLDCTNDVANGATAAASCP